MKQTLKITPSLFYKIPAITPITGIHVSKAHIYVSANQITHLVGRSGVDKGNTYWKLQNLKGLVRGLDTDEHGTTAYLVTDGDKILSFTTQQQRARGKLATFSGVACNYLSLSIDGRLLTACGDQFLQIFDRDGKEVSKIPVPPPRNAAKLKFNTFRIGGTLDDSHWFGVTDEDILIGSFGQRTFDAKLPLDPFGSVTHVSVTKSDVRHIVVAKSEINAQFIRTQLFTYKIEKGIERVSVSSTIYSKPTCLEISSGGRIVAYGQGDFLSLIEVKNNWFEAERYRVPGISSVAFAGTQRLYMGTNQGSVYEFDRTDL